MYKPHCIRALVGLLALLLPIAALAFDGTPASASQTEGGSRVMPLVGGSNHVCALQADGSAACWGSNQFQTGQTDVPTGATFIALTAGGYHTCGLQPDGRAICWGSNLAGQSNVPADTRFTSLVAGEFHTCGLKADGSALCWGANNDGQSNVPVGATFVALTASSQHTCGLKADGRAVCWGDNTFHEIEVPANKTFTALTAGGYHTCGLQENGVVVCWGNNDYLQLEVPVNTTFTTLAAGWVHTCGLKADGSAVCWGFNDDGRTSVPADTIFTALAPLGIDSCGLKADGSVICWGPSFASNQMVVPAHLQQPGSIGFGQVAVGNAHACELKRDGHIACWGGDNEGQADAPSGQFTQVVAGDSHSCAIGTDSKVTCWGNQATENNARFGNDDFRRLGLAMSGRSCALRIGSQDLWCYDPRTSGAQGSTSGWAVGTVSLGGNQMCWVNRAGGAGTAGAATCRYTSFLYADGNSDIPGPWQVFEAGLNHACGLKTDGTLQCYGDDTEGQTDGVPTGTFRALSTGYNHACAIRDNGQLACWGSNASGQIDAPEGTYVQVAAGNTFTCAIRSDGQRVCWGASSGSPLNLDPAILADGAIGTAYSAQLSVSGSEAPELVLFALMGGSLPPGLALNEETGEIAGTPTMAGAFTFTIDAEGSGAFAASRTYTVTITGDATPPIITSTLVSLLPGNSGWYIGNVTVSWAVVDAESAITSSIGCDPTTLNSDTLGATFTCTATSAGGTSSATTSTLKRDATAPTLAPSVPSPILRGGSYSASPNASDATSGVASSSCGPLDASSTGNKSITCIATDVAGNVNTVTLGYTVTTTCSNDGYSGTQLTWCRNICEMGYTGATLDTWIHRWVDRYRNLPYCRVAPQTQLR